MPIPAGLRALGHRDYRRFFVGQVISQSGSWTQGIGQSWLVLLPLLAMQELHRGAVPLRLFPLAGAITWKRRLRFR